MLDTFLKLIDRLIALSKERTSRNRRLFEAHVDPIYNSAQIVVDDYRQVLESIEQQLADSTVSIDQVLTDLRDRRKRYERARVELVEYSEILYRTQSADEVLDFAAACLQLLRSDPASPQENGPAPSPLTSLEEHVDSSSLLDDIEEYKAHDLRRTHLSGLPSIYLRQIDSRWRVFVQIYYELRTECLS